MSFPSLINPQLVAFYWIASTQSVIKAAKTLNLTQTAVTQRLKGLEELVGVTLFLRTRKGMILTSEGQRLFAYVHEAQFLESQLWQDLSGQNEGREIDVTIAGPTSVMSSRIVTCCTPVIQAFPELRLHFKIDDSIDTVGQLRKNEIQFGIVSSLEVPSDLESKRLKPQEFVLVGHPDWSGDSLREIILSRRIIDFHQNDFTTIRYLKHFKILPKSLPSRIFANQNEVLIQMLQSGIGFGTLTREVAASSLKENKLILLNHGKFFSDPLALVWLPRHFRPKYFQGIVSNIK